MNYIEKIKKIHNYDYSNTIIENSKSMINVFCSIHGEFTIRADHHLNGQGCPKCMIEKKREKYKNDFIKKAKEKHGDKYDYSLVNYINRKTKVQIICPYHGVFEQKPYIHLQNHGCQICGKNTSNTGEFIKAKEIHNTKYDYSFVDYKHSHDKIKIKCEKHGIFYQSPEGHLSGRGCPKCRLSQGERKIESFLDYYHINYESQKKFTECKDKRELPFDFYLSDYNICIEYDGIQHFEIIDFFGEKAYNKIILHDKIKTDYCLENNITLFRIKYNDNIAEKLKFLYNLLF